MWENITDSTRGDATWEIIIMLLVAFILGYLLRYFIGKGKEGDNYHAEMEEWKAKYRGVEGKVSGLQADLDACRKQKATPMAAAAPVINTNKDDLTKVEGIGPKVQDLLYADGIFSWQQLSLAEPARLRKILDDAGGIYKQRNPDTWPKQAGMAHDGKWEELKVWQDEHIHGLDD